MPPDIALAAAPARAWSSRLVQLGLVWLLLFVVTFEEWAQMAHQWWNIDTYSHILLIPAIIAWLVWIKRNELAALVPEGWWPALAWFGAGFLVWLGGRALDINLFAQAGAVMTFQGAAIALLGLRVSLILALPMAYSCFLVPFGDEIIPQLQAITAHLATWLTQASGVAMVSDGIYIDTPAGLFIVAEACSGVKFLIAMVTLGTLVAFTCFESWSRRAWLMLACVVVPIIANGIRAWATIFIAQYVGAEAAGSFDHIVYGWFFFGIVIALVLGFAWRWFERDPEDAGWSLAEIEAMPAVATFERKTMTANFIVAIMLAVAIVFAAAAHLG